MESAAPKVALVTASSAGLGAVTARAFALAGYSTIVNYFSNADKANALVGDIMKDIAAAGKLSGSSTAGKTVDQRCIAIRADHSQREEIQRLVNEAVRTMGRLDVVVSNQGWTQMRNFNDIDDNVIESDWDGCFNMNVKSHLWLFHAANPHLQATEGSFVSVASLAGVIPSGSSIVCVATTCCSVPAAIVVVRQIRSASDYFAAILGHQSRTAAPGEIVGEDIWPQGPNKFGVPRHSAYSKLLLVSLNSIVALRI